LRVFVGITGASGAPYAARLLEGLRDAGVEVGVCASESAGEVIAYEVYRDRSMRPSQAIERLVREHGGKQTTLYSERDWFSPYASGSALVDAYVICPCSMGTLGTIAAGSMTNLIHRAASVALKEGRRLILVPRETPLSTIHLENMLRVRQAGAVVLFAAPGFYHGAETVDELVAFVVGRCLDQLGIEHALTKRWGE